MKEAEFKKYIDNLFSRAFKSSPFDALCTILRVKGLSDSNWDPFEESLDAFDDFNWFLKRSIKEHGDRCTRRIALLIYCQAIEMTAIHEMLANLLRCITGKPYVISPFGHLQKRKKKQFLDWIPPSALAKFREIKKLADEAGEENLSKCIDSFFNEHVRNAFSHSDFILTDTEFRSTEGGLAKSIKVSELDQLISICFDFYKAFIATYKQWRLILAQSKQYHKWPNYEVLELLSDKKEGIYGFHVHFSNGSKATYTRKRSGTEAINFGFNRDGTIYFMVGDLEKLESVWKVNGEPVTDWEALAARKEVDT